MSALEVPQTLRKREFAGLLTDDIGCGGETKCIRYDADSNQQVFGGGEDAKLV